LIRFGVVGRGAVHNTGSGLNELASNQ
jgi:hypothetical protein